MRQDFVFILIVSCSISMFSQDVSESLAVQMASHYYQMLSHNKLDSNIRKVQIKISTNEVRHPQRISPLNKAYMWFVPVDDGWVLISGSTKATPILAHIQSYDMPIYDSLPPAAKELINSYEDYIAYINNHSNEYQVNEKWNSVLHSNSSSPQSMKSSYTEVGPLLSVHWGQSGGGTCSSNKVYNKFCPIVSSTLRCGRAPAGCVAVAIAQIMWYWNWPYAAQIPTTIGGNDTELVFYDWAKMPVAIRDSTDMEKVDMIAGFLRDCGYKLDMNYGANGSSASEENAVQTLKDFGYDENTIQLCSKWNTSGWTNLLRSNIDNGRPVYYSGRSSSLGGEGHAFVVDGYRTGDAVYHINWGWDDVDSDGWYNIDDAFINDTTHYEHWQEAIFGIKPAPICADLTFNSSIQFPSKFCYAIGGNVTISNVTIDNVIRGEIYSNTQVKLMPGVTINEGSNVYIGIKDIPCSTTSGNVSTLQNNSVSRKNFILEKESINKDNFSISPSFVYDVMTVQTNLDIGLIYIYNLSGNCLLQIDGTEINVSALPAGMYIVRAVTTTGEQLQSKFIKQ